MAAKVVGNDAF